MINALYKWPCLGLNRIDGADGTGVVSAEEIPVSDRFWVNLQFLSSSHLCHTVEFAASPKLIRRCRNFGSH